MGAQWLSGRVLDSRPRAADSSLNGVTALCSWARHINPSLVLVQPRMTRPYIIERSLMGRKESNQTNRHFTCMCYRKRTYTYAIPWSNFSTLWSRSDKSHSWLTLVVPWETTNMDFDQDYAYYLFVRSGAHLPRGVACLRTWRKRVDTFMLMILKGKHFRTA